MTTRTILATTKWSVLADDHISGLAWNPDGKQVAVATAEGTVAILDGHSGNTVRERKAHGPGSTLVDWSGGGLASCGFDGNVRLWTPDGESKPLDAGASWVEHLAWAADGDLLASAAGKVLRIWSADGTLRFETRDAPSTIAAMCWRKDSKAIGIACYGGARLLRIGESQPYEELEWKGSLLSLAWSPNSRYVAAGSQEATVNFWKLPFRSGEQLHMTGYATKVRELAWDPKSRFLATGGGDVITIWDVSGKGPARSKPLRLEGHQDKVTHLLYDKTGIFLASADPSGRACVWRPDLHREPVITWEFAGAVSAVQWSPDGRALAWGTAQGEVAVWETEAD